MHLPARAFAAVSCVVLAGCDAAVMPSRAAGPAPAAAFAGDLTGVWTGGGTDPQGDETFRWTVQQTGEQIAGSVIMESSNPTDGSCGSCHKQKRGTLSGRLSGGALTVTLDFPAGGDDVTPLCGITMTAVTSDVADGRIAGTYTGTTTCEGPIAGGALMVTR